MKTLTLVKGDSISLDVEIDTDITGWSIRAEIFDECGNCIRLATSNITGGSDDQIEITETATDQSFFRISVPKGKTTCFNKDSKIEIEAETPESVGGELEKNTIFQGKIIFLVEEITWDQP